MADPFELPRVDAIPSRSPRDSVDPLRHATDQHRQKRRHPPPPPPAEPREAEPDEDKQVGTRLDVRV